MSTAKTRGARASDARRALGAEGEARAAAHLVARGYRILARNVRAGRVEIDLVAARGALVAFVEVKTRRSRVAGLPEEAVDFRKRERLAHGAAAWLAEQRSRWARVRFDVVACERDAGGGWSIRHLENAFDAGE
ncbi:MAG: YraN family protein [Proteobacteria bacterium]|nr:MAG: YraN family protein [Pseudomonadota bacterium]